MINTIVVCLLLIFIFFRPTVNANNFLPEQIIQLDNKFSHHVIIAEKATHKIHLYKNDQGSPKLVKSYLIATGKKSGDKLFQGDYRTPEGIYHFNHFLTHKELLRRHGKSGEIYGVGAFVLNYPNFIDKSIKKTGSGIWLHSTNDETRIDKGLDSRGCVVSANKDLIDISQYIEINKTPIIITEHLKFLPQKNWLLEKNKLTRFVESWLLSWKEEDLLSYIESYHPLEFHTKKLGNRQALKNYKRSVFSREGKPSIDIDNISFLRSPDYVVVTFRQIYKSKNINDIGKKTLYLKLDNYYKWKIVHENWEKLEENSNLINERLTFEPSMRFFKTRNPSQIMSNIKSSR